MNQDENAFVKQLGKYQIQSEIGKGGMGIVYKAHDPLIDRLVALKTIRKDLLDHKEVLLRFQREAQAAGRLTHPNIVAVYEYGEDNEIAFIAMEYVQGRSLKTIFDNKERLDLTVIVRIMSQILGALAYSHEKGVVHRDIKPENIILSDQDQVKITDFGIAHIESSDLTQTGTVLGTPKYMSPEQVTGQKIDERSDIFSTGVILYEFITGENPFDGQSQVTVMHKILNVDPIEPEKLNFHISSSLNAVIQKAIAKKPDERFQSAKDFYQAINDAIQHTFSPDSAEQSEARDNDPSKTVILSPSDKRKRTTSKTLGASSTGQTRHPPATEEEAENKEEEATGGKKWIPALIVLVVLLGAGFFAKEYFFPQKAAPPPETPAKVVSPEKTIPPEKPEPALPEEHTEKTAPLAPQYGYVNLVTTPWTTVYIENRSCGNTPIAELKLGAGEVKVRFVNPSYGIDRVETLIVEADTLLRKSYHWE